MTVADGIDLTRRVTRALAAILYKDRSEMLKLPGVVSCDVVPGLNGQESLMLRLRMADPRGQGQRYRFYTVRISEMTE